MEAARMQEAQVSGEPRPSGAGASDSRTAQTGLAGSTAGPSGDNSTKQEDSASNFMWPSGFTPENQPFSLSMPDSTEPTMAQFMQGFGPFGTDPAVTLGGEGGEASGSGSNSAYFPGRQDSNLSAALGTFGDGFGFGFNTSPGTDMRLLNALENQAAFIEGNPDEDKDLELYYYRFVGVFGSPQVEGVADAR